MYQYHLILLTTFFLAACSGNDGKVIHPTTEFLEEIKAADYTVSLNDENLPSISILNNRKTINIIGETEDVDSEYFLPEVGDISVGSKLIFIVIPQMNEIRAFDYLGNFKYKIGRTGHGPGEFEKLHSIDYDEASKKLVAVDLNEVEIFDVKPDTAIPSQTFIITQVSHLSDACILNGELFLNGSNISEVDTLESDASIYSRLQALPPINKYDLETGEKLFHFGKSYKSVSGFGGFDALLSETKLHCNESTNTIVGVFSRYPFIAGYDPANGSEKWNAGILDFISPQVEEKDIEN
ncbi:MAG: 6-bladed beta-propeller, partial [Balneolaceae bacterium]